MPSDRPAPIEPAQAQRLLDRIAPGYRFDSFGEAAGAYTNQVQRLTATSPGNPPLRLVLKLLTDSRDPERAVAEFHGLRTAHRGGISVPEPVFLDSEGTLLGAPGLVTKFVPGTQDMRPADFGAWAIAQAEILLQIHAITPSESERVHLYRGNEIGLYFLHDHWPETNAGHPLSEAIFSTVTEFKSTLRKTRSCLLHMDFWPGNVLWQAGRISAVVDWDGAAYGDPALDVGNFRMEMHLRGIPEAADLFLERYERTAGTVANLGFWELAAAARPLPEPAKWLLQLQLEGGREAAEQRLQRDFQAFVEAAIARARRRR